MGGQEGVFKPSAALNKAVEGPKESGGRAQDAAAWWPFAISQQSPQFGPI